MKHTKQTLTGLLAIILLCCACSGTGANGTASDTTVANLTAAAPMAQQTASTSGYTDVAPGAWYEEAANWCREQGILDGDAFPRIWR